MNTQTTNVVRDEILSATLQIAQERAFAARKGGYALGDVERAAEAADSAADFGDYAQVVARDLGYEVANRLCKSGLWEEGDDNAARRAFAGRIAYFISREVARACGQEPIWPDRKMPDRKMMVIDFNDLLEACRIEHDCESIPAGSIAESQRDAHGWEPSYGIICEFMDYGLSCVGFNDYATYGENCRVVAMQVAYDMERDGFTVENKPPRMSARFQYHTGSIEGDLIAETPNLGV